MQGKKITEMIPETDKAAREICGEVRNISFRMKTPHIGSSFSCVDILVSLYWNVVNISNDKSDDPERDRVILSKGHAALALYATLAYKCILSTEIFSTYA